MNLSRESSFLRFDGVQVLRFVAAFAVLISHSTRYTSERLDPHLGIWRTGGAGVDIFFVISGFVIVLASRNKGTDGWVNWRSFLAKRMLRIYPMYWLATLLNLIVLLMMPTAVLHSHFDAGALVGWMLLIPTLNSDGRVEPLLGVGWTLYFETFFYALFALSLALKRSPYLVLPPILIACALASAWRQPDWPAATVYLDPRVLEFLLGMAIAAYKDRLVQHQIAGVGTLVVGLGVIFAFGSVGGLPEFGARAVGSALIVAGTVAIEPQLSGRVPRVLLFLGAASYAIYLIHPLTVPIVPMLMNKLHLLSAGISLIGCITVGLVIPSFIHRVIEVPMLVRGMTWLRAREGDVSLRRDAPPEVA